MIQGSCFRPSARKLPTSIFHHIFFFPSPSINCLRLRNDRANVRL